MGRKSRTSVLKRQREVKKAERAAMKAAQQDDRPDRGDGGGGQLATADDLAGYGVGPADEEEETEA